MLQIVSQFQWQSFGKRLLSCPKSWTEEAAVHSHLKNHLESLKFESLSSDYWLKRKCKMFYQLRGIVLKDIACMKLPRYYRNKVHLDKQSNLPSSMSH